MRPLADLVGKTFGRLIVLRRIPREGDRNARWLCRCACGSEKAVYGYNLKNSMVRSCGCMRSESGAITGPKNLRKGRDTGRFARERALDAIFKPPQPEIDRSHKKWLGAKAAALDLWAAMDGRMK